MSGRILNDWLSWYIHYASGPTESPYNYHVWTGLSVIAGALQRRCYIKWGFTHLYPNLYVVLVGPSGVRKGEAINAGSGIFRETSLPKLPEDVTRERLIRRIAESTTNYQDPDTGKIEYHSSMTLFSPEWVVFLGQGDIHFLGTLTDWYESAPTWERETKHQGNDEIIGVCLNMLGAAASDWIPSMIPKLAIGGGFTSRIIFVVEEEKAKILPRPDITIEANKLYRCLVHDLQKITNLAGEFKMTDDALEAYDDWYTQQEKDAANGIFPIDDVHFRGYRERRATHVKKIAMILSASKGEDKMITQEDFEQARKMLARIEPKMPKVFGGVGDSPHGVLVAKILDFIRQHGVVRRSEVLNYFYRDLGSAAALDLAEGTLVDMKRIDKKRDLETHDTIYTYVEKPNSKSETDS